MVPLPSPNPQKLRLWSGSPHSWLKLGELVRIENLPDMGGMCLCALAHQVCYAPAHLSLWKSGDLGPGWVSGEPDHSLAGGKECRTRPYQKLRQGHSLSPHLLNTHTWPCGLSALDLWYCLNIRGGGYICLAAAIPQKEREGRKQKDHWEIRHDYKQVKITSSSCSLFSVYW